MQMTVVKTRELTLKAYEIGALLQELLGGLHVLNPAQKCAVPFATPMCHVVAFVLRMLVPATE